MRIKFDLGNGKFEEFDMDENKTMKDHFKDIIKEMHDDLPIELADKERLKREALDYLIGTLGEDQKKKLNKTMREISN